MTRKNITGHCLLAAAAAVFCAGAQAHVQHTHFQRVAGLGAFDVHRAGEDVARPVAHAAGMDFAQFGRHVEAGRRQRVGAAADAVDGDVVAALHA